MESIRIHWIRIFQGYCRLIREVTRLQPPDTDADYKSGTIRNIRRNFNKKTLYELLPRHAKFTPDLLLKLQQIPISILENRACPLAIKVYKMAREVSKDCERAKQFTRTQINDHGLLY